MLSCILLAEITKYLQHIFQNIDVIGMYFNME